MIITVTINPAIDKTAGIETIHPRALNRLTRVEKDVGGKGINVSKAVAALGGSSTACGFLAGSTGRLIEELLREKGITPDFIWVSGETRTNLKLVEPGGHLTEFNEQGPTVTEKELEALRDKLVSYATPGTIFVLAGSGCPGVPEDIYRQLILAVKARGSRVFLDADGPLFAQAIEACPDVVKPNSFELAQYFGLEREPSRQEILTLGRRLLEKGVGLVCVSMGGEGACFLTREGACFAPSLPVEVRSTVGAGDTMAAAVCYGLDQGKPLEACFRLALAASAGAVTTEGTKPPDRALVSQLEAQVTLTPVGV